jgi:Arc/MetJ family transcription regulator
LAAALFIRKISTTGRLMEQCGSKILLSPRLLPPHHASDAVYASGVRTTIDIDDELLTAVKKIAHQKKTTAGRVVSTLLREALGSKSVEMEYRNGIPVLPRRPNGPVGTMELVNRLRDEDE